MKTKVFDSLKAEAAFYEELASGAVVVQTLNRAPPTNHTFLFISFTTLNLKKKKCDV
jgi:hypothetical protein